MAKGPVLLFVDEGPDWLLEIRDRLVSRYHVLAVETGPEALTVLEKHPVALLLTDNAMASVQDRRFAQSLRYDHGALPRILFAERPELEMAIASRNGNRIDGALPKPCDTARVVSLIHRVVGEATMRVSMRRPTAPTQPETTPIAKSGNERETLPDPAESTGD